MEYNLPYIIIADEVAYPHANQEIISVCLRFVDFTPSKEPHIRECLINFLNLERANAFTKILDSLSHPSVSLDPTKAAVMSSEVAGVHVRIKEIPPLALYSHCYSHCLNLFIVSSCKVQEVRNIIDFINEAILLLTHSPKLQTLFEMTL